MSQARNVGLDICTGDYIAFVDSDDFIKLNMYETLLKYMTKEKADIAWCDYIEEYVQKNIKHNLFIDKKIYDLKDNTNKKVFARDLFYKYHFEAYAWNKLYKRFIWDSLRFPYKTACEDGYTLMWILSKAKKILVIPEALYYYRRDNINSLSKIKNKKVRYGFTESRLIRAIEYNVLYPNSKEANILLYRAYREAFKYILSTRDKDYKFCGKFVSKQAIRLLKKNLPIKKCFSMLLSVIIYNLVEPLYLRK